MTTTNDDNDNNNDYYYYHDYYFHYYYGRVAEGSSSSTAAPFAAAGVLSMLDLLILYVTVLLIHIMYIIVITLLVMIILLLLLIICVYIYIYTHIHTYILQRWCSIAPCLLLLRRSHEHMRHESRQESPPARSLRYPPLARGRHDEPRGEDLRHLAPLRPAEAKRTGFRGLSLSGGRQRDFHTAQPRIVVRFSAETLHDFLR